MDSHCEQDTRSDMQKTYDVITGSKLVFGLTIVFIVLLVAVFTFSYTSLQTGPLGQ